ncbi:PAAR domain-containing protein [Vibrio parahaemolyticus]|uniref:PAAR domain-containing protein n=1 Tax=Vibrio parahaemolyticus TaxID=670 RepID=UPI00215C88CE|nr:PAAR domain-containing protein [Vibrio parahaemolyticus]MCR9778953.1 PAAR domain-containing protein [Vibrio parahaemolyticus]
MSVSFENRGVVRKGDTTTTGGVVLQGTPDFGIFNEQVAIAGMIATCLKCKKGWGYLSPLYKVPFTYGIENIQIILHEDNVNCDCPVGTNTVIASTQSLRFSMKNGMGTLVKTFESAAEREELINGVTQGLFTTQFTEDSLKDEDAIVNDGVFVWVETQGTGHTLLTVHDSDITMFSYGRYDDLYPNTFGTQGEGVLIKASNKDCKSYLREQLFVKDAHVFKVTDVKVFEVFDYLNNIWSSSNEYPDSSLSGELTKEHGRVIDSYNLFERNCTTTMVDALNKSGSKVFKQSILGLNVNEAFTIPASLGEYLERASKSFDMLVVDVTKEMKLFLDNPDSLKINQPSTKEVLYGVATSFGVTLGSSSGYDIGNNND